MKIPVEIPMPTPREGRLSPDPMVDAALHAMADRDRQIDELVAVRAGLNAELARLRHLCGLQHTELVRLEAELRDTRQLLAEADADNVHVLRPDGDGRGPLVA